MNNNFSRIDNESLSIPKHNNREKNKFYFDDFDDDDIVEHRRKYQNDWTELREFVGFDDIELVDNELVIINRTGQIQKLVSKSLFPKIYTRNYNILRMMAGMGGLAYST